MPKLTTWWLDMFTRIKNWMINEINKWRGVEDDEPWYVKEHVGFCPFCGSASYLPEDVEKGSGEKVKCGRRKDGTTPVGYGCGRDLFA
jgi:hypothetical protein